eukprot:scaffold2161_cov212-Alexandrium_tamarense.AAC.39
MKFRGPPIHTSDVFPQHHLPTNWRYFISIQRAKTVLSDQSPFSSTCLTIQPINPNAASPILNPAQSA